MTTTTSPLRSIARQWLIFENHPGAPQTTYRAWSLANYDGDTITAMLEVGDMLCRPTDVRVLGINAPELHKGTARQRAAGATARDFTAARVAPRADGSNVALMLTDVQQDPNDKYGRLLARVLYYGTDSQWHDLAAELLAAKLAKPYMVPPAPPTPTP